MTSDGSHNPELAGRKWVTPGDDPVEVSGPDWAVLAWLTGRTGPAAAVLTAAPELDPWQ